MKQFLVHAWENVRDGCKAIWAAIPRDGHLLLIGVGIGVMIVGAFAWLLS